MIERLALLLYWRVPRGRKIVRGYIFEHHRLVDVFLPRGWILARRGRSWRLERPENGRAAAW